MEKKICCFGHCNTELYINNVVHDREQLQICFIFMFNSAPQQQQWRIHTAKKLSDAGEDVTGERISILN